LGTFWRILKRNALVCFVVIWYDVVPFGIHILWPFCICCGCFLYFGAIWYILWPICICCAYLVFFSVLVCSPKKYLATLFPCRFFGNARYLHTISLLTLPNLHTKIPKINSNKRMKRNYYISCIFTAKGSRRGLAEE
jgi:hypothetical protein